MIGALAAVAMESDDGSDGDPEPATDPPAWARALVADARRLAGRDVYAPSDDTFLLLEVLAADSALLAARRPCVCLEVGSGSGAVLAGLGDVLRRSGGRGPPPLLLATDKNSEAAQCSDRVLRLHGTAAKGAVVRTAFASGLRVQADVVVCNPPYVPTPKEEMQGCGIEVSWAGGDRGREMIDDLLPKVAVVLAPGGLFYLLCMEENEPNEILEVAAARYGLAGEIARREERGIEVLFVLRFELRRDAGE